jgi:hypothetical protein
MDRRIVMIDSNFTLRCMNGFTLHVRGANLIVATKRSEEMFPISKIQSFSFKAPRGIGAGKIVFRTAQAATSGINLGFGIGAAFGAEKTFFFSKSDLEDARRLHEYVTSYEEMTAGR